MLSKKDKEEIRKIFKEEITKALTVKVRMERRRDIQTGQALSVPEIEIKDVYLPDHWVEFLPWYEASLRGVQENSDHIKNKMEGNNQVLENIAQILFRTEGAMRKLVKAASIINELPDNHDIKALEVHNENK